MAAVMVKQYPVERERETLMVYWISRLHLKAGALLRKIRIPLRQQTMMTLVTVQEDGKAPQRPALIATHQRPQMGREMYLSAYECALTQMGAESRTKLMENGW
jgi:hypothetical protein